jgi:anti-sigma factor RsiW
MRLLPLKIFAAAAVAVVLSAAGVVSVTRAGGDTTLRDISRYREWARVTEAPLEVPAVNAAAGGG